jgi:nitrogen-specific signal transduction histidine kinase
MVQQRTAEVLESQSLLRRSERLASIGTLAAGLGHDIGNVLMPLSVHLRNLQEQLAQAGAGTEQSQRSLAAVDRAMDYLRNLSNGLRMLARDPAEIVDRQAATDLGEWWSAVRPLLEAMAQRGMRLEHEFPSDLPRVRLAEHLLTQVIFNLVQNAVQALADRKDGRIVIQAGVGDDDPEQLVLRVSDNGPGMTPEVQRRCLEPFFTTKTRVISSGLGLSIVSGIVQNSGGTLHVESNLGQGTIFTLRLPIAPGASTLPRLPADVTINDARLRALVTRLLDTHLFQPTHRSPGEGPREQSQLWVVDSEAMPAVETQALHFLNGADGPRRRVLAIGSASASPATDERIIQVDRQFQPTAFRSALDHIARELQAS